MLLPSGNLSFGNYVLKNSQSNVVNLTGCHLGWLHRNIDLTHNATINVLDNLRACHQETDV